MGVQKVKKKFDTPYFLKRLELIDDMSVASRMSHAVIEHEKQLDFEARYWTWICEFNDRSEMKGGIQYQFHSIFRSHSLIFELLMCAPRETVTLTQHIPHSMSIGGCVESRVRSTTCCYDARSLSMLIFFSVQVNDWNQNWLLYVFSFCCVWVVLRMIRLDRKWDETVSLHVWKRELQEMREKFEWIWIVFDTASGCRTASESPRIVQEKIERERRAEKLKFSVCVGPTTNGDGDELNSKFRFDQTPFGCANWPIKKFLYGLLFSWKLIARAREKEMIDNHHMIFIIIFSLFGEIYIFISSLLLWIDLIIIKKKSLKFMFGNIWQIFPTTAAAFICEANHGNWQFVNSTFSYPFSL